VVENKGEKAISFDVKSTSYLVLEFEKLNLAKHENGKV
jgi:hypothetical protein